jgi:hypothetical protein
VRPAVATPGRVAALHVYISHPTALDDLCAFLKRAECVVQNSHAHGFDVRLPRAFSEAQARRELDIYLATWQVTHPGVEAYVVDRDGVA